MKKKGFTLVELLVVIAIIAMLMGILMPALGRVRFIAQRVVCGTHLSSLGKSMLTYANDYDQKYVRGGGKDSWWGPLSGSEGWDSRSLPPPDPPPGQPGAFGGWTNCSATIGSCLYLLVKYADAGTRIFICGGDTLAREFNLQDYPGHTVYKNDTTEAWDFGGPSNTIGNPPAQHYSYAYQSPFGTIETTYYPLTPYADSDMAVMADRSPYLVLETDATALIYWYGGTKEEEKRGNSTNHRSEGQNVLFNDGSVRYEEKPYCGADRDNIYTMQTATTPKECGAVPPACFEAGPPTPASPSLAVPQSKTDSVLINEGEKQRTARKK